MVAVDIRTPLERVARGWFPRILTQICRDPTSPFHGSADRNWWHYKIRDFSSIILQQSGYCVHLAGQLPGWSEHRAQLDALAEASARFWNERARKHHAFEEYYPWEQGYPPLAFSTLAMARLADAGVAPVEALRPGLGLAQRQLRRRLEDKAGNQQVAGLAALAWADRILPDSADPPAFAEQKARTLALQHEEGWYWEYDGPDLGYLSVTIDCLWDLYDATGDEDYRDSARRALGFAALVLASAPAGAGLHNSRNTDYLVPYGIVRSALEGHGQERRDATWIAATLFAKADSPSHFLAAVDDRYICHYLGPSLFRALLLLGERQLDPVAPPRVAPVLLPGSGHYLEAGLIIACRKGGTLTVGDGAMEASDFGWVVERGRRQFVSHWWSDRWDFRQKDGSIELEGGFVAHKEHPPTPIKHMLLRLLSFALGRRLAAGLKRLLIFKPRADGGEPLLRRSIARDGQGLKIVDRITGLKAGDRLVRAPRASKRHVASADSFHPQDLALLRGFEREEERRHEGAAVTVTIRLRPV